MTICTILLYYMQVRFTNFVFLTAVALYELQQQVKNLVELVQKLRTEFREVKTQLEESQVDVDGICDILKDITGVNT